MSSRRFWLLVHRINGLLIAVFVTVAGATGSVLAWKAPLERFFAPKLFVLPAHASQSRVDPVQVWSNVSKAFPWATVDMLDLSTKSDQPLEFSLVPRNTETAARRDDEAYADPYTGRILGSRRDADLRQGRKNTVPFVYALHENLALGNIGTMLLGLAALLWTLDCFIGVYLTFPAILRKAEPRLAKRFSAWPGRWRPSWQVRWRQGPFKRWYDIHRASGLWLWSFLLIFAWTGVVFNLPFVAQPVLRALGAAPEQILESACLSAPSFSGDSSVWSAALTDARSRMRAAASQQNFTVREERFLSYDRQQCEWTYRVRSSRDVDRIGNTQLRWATGTRAIFTAPTGITRTDTVTTWMEAIHEAQTGGVGLRLIVTLTGLVTVVLSITGVWLYIRKTRRARL